MIAAHYGYRAHYSDRFGLAISDKFRSLLFEAGSEHQLMIIPIRFEIETTEKETFSHFRMSSSEIFVSQLKI